MNTKSDLGNWLEWHTLMETCWTFLCLFIWGLHLLSHASQLRPEVMSSATVHSHGGGGWLVAGGVARRLQHSKKAVGETDCETLLGFWWEDPHVVCLEPESPATLLMCCLYSWSLHCVMEPVWPEVDTDTMLIPASFWSGFFFHRTEVEWMLTKKIFLTQWFSPIEKLFESGETGQWHGDILVCEVHDAQAGGPKVGHLATM